MDRTRTQDLFNANWRSVTMVGVGGIGAITAITLGKMGFSTIYLFDPDTVEEVNVATQFFGNEMILKPKVVAVKEYMRMHAFDVETIARQERVGDPEVLLPGSDIVICSVDSINARKRVWTAYNGNIDFGLYIDARMNAENLQLYCITDQHSRDQYNKMLSRQNEEDFPELPCTAKATFYTANLAAANIGYLCRRFITSEPIKQVYVIDLPNSSMITV